MRRDVFERDIQETAELMARREARFPSARPLTEAERLSGRLAVGFKLTEAIDLAHRAGLPAVVTDLLGIKQRLVEDIAADAAQPVTKG